MAGPGIDANTPAAQVAQAWGMAYVNLVERLREHHQAKTDLGLLMKPYLDAGMLVPGELLVQMVIAGLGAAQSWMVKSFPHSRAHAQLLTDHGYLPDLLVELCLDEASQLDRMGGWRQCAKCGVKRHLFTHPPTRVGVCDPCGAPYPALPDHLRSMCLEKIADYRERTDDVVGYYQGRSRLVRVSAQGGGEATSARFAAALGGSVAP
ncbi:hypothetical protein Rhe02_05120 [Rhizocola hellebori]|uniref:Adenylate kinase n=2 Tax=Rhizocola hellebori TaxID=1392758 RepID=A0A8J3Q288_9ACTN|nr:hypothetical protein Rhe02_05120 [Rhizocola hellebori]